MGLNIHFQYFSTAWLRNDVSDNVLVGKVLLGFVPLSWMLKKLADVSHSKRPFCEQQLVKYIRCGKML